MSVALLSNRVTVISLGALVAGVTLACGEATAPRQATLANAYAATAIDGAPLPAAVTVRMPSGLIESKSLVAAELDLFAGTMQWHLVVQGPDSLNVANYIEAVRPAEARIIGRDSVEIFATGDAARMLLAGHVSDTLLVLGPPSGADPQVPLDSIFGHRWTFRPTALP